MFLILLLKQCFHSFIQCFHSFIQQLFYSVLLMCRTLSYMLGLQNKQKSLPLQTLLSWETYPREILLPQFSWAAVTKYHRLGGFKPQTFLRVLAAEKASIKVPADLVLGTTYSLCSCGGESECSVLSLPFLVRIEILS